jgi:hypothetical protein
MCILGDVGVEVGYHDVMMSDEKRVEAGVSFLGAGGFAHMAVAYGSSGRGRVVKTSNIKG